MHCGPLKGCSSVRRCCKAVGQRRTESGQLRMDGGETAVEADCTPQLRRFSTLSNDLHRFNVAHYAMHSFCIIQFFALPHRQQFPI